MFEEYGHAQTMPSCPPHSYSSCAVSSESPLVDHVINIFISWDISSSYSCPRCVPDTTLLIHYSIHVASRSFKTTLSYVKMKILLNIKFPFFFSKYAYATI